MDAGDVFKSVSEKLADILLTISTGKLQFVYHSLELQEVVHGYI
jgi:hypothetical protein